MIDQAEREAYRQLLERYGSARARQLLGTVRLLALYGRQELLGGALLSRATFYRDLDDLRSAGLSERVELVEAERVLRRHREREVGDRLPVGEQEDQAAAPVVVAKGAPAPPKRQRRGRRR